MWSHNTVGIGINRKKNSDFDVESGGGIDAVIKLRPRSKFALSPRVPDLPRQRSLCESTEFLSSDSNFNFADLAATTERAELSKLRSRLRRAFLFSFARVY